MRVVIVHTLEDAKAALAAAVRLKKTITLQSAPDAVRYAGSLYLFHMFEEARKAYPTADATFILDCSESEADALNAMQVGHKNIRIRNSNKIQQIAKQYGVKVHAKPYEALDLGKAGNTTEACKKWLSEDV